MLTKLIKVLLHDLELFIQGVWYKIECILTNPLISALSLLASVGVIALTCCLRLCFSSILLILSSVSLFWWSLLIFSRVCVWVYHLLVLWVLSLLILGVKSLIGHSRLWSVVCSVLILSSLSDQSLVTHWILRSISPLLVFPSFLRNMFIPWVSDFLSSWVSDFLSYWVSDFLSSWVSDFLSSWVSDFLSYWVSDFLSSRVSDFLSSWVSDFLSSWVSDFLSSRVSDFLSFWVSAYLSIYKSRVQICWIFPLLCIFLSTTVSPTMKRLLL